VTHSALGKDSSLPIECRLRLQGPRCMPAGNSRSLRARPELLAREPQSALRGRRRQREPAIGLTVQGRGLPPGSPRQATATRRRRGGFPEARSARRGGRVFASSRTSSSGSSSATFATGLGALPSRARAASGSSTRFSTSRATVWRRSSSTRACQETPLTIAPPTSGPIAIARPPMPPQTPSASPRRSRGTAAERMVSVSGVTTAAPTPCTARAMSSAFADVERAAAAEAQVKSSKPSANMGRDRSGLRAPRR
jgi:hypothetical protein